MDPTESTLLFNETEPRILMKMQVAVSGYTFQAVFCGVRHFLFSLCSNVQRKLSGFSALLKTLAFCYIELLFCDG